MQPQSPNRNDPPENIDVRMRTMRTLWFAMFFSVVMYYGLTLFVGQRENVTPNNTLSLALMIVSLSTILVSFIIKNKLLGRAIEQQQPQRVQQAYIVALALAEVPALLGVLDFFATGDRFYYVLIIMAVAAQLLHFPRREHVEHASYKRSSF
jgi:hypothetical protein